MKLRILIKDGAVSLAVAVNDAGGEILVDAVYLRTPHGEYAPCFLNEIEVVSPLSPDKSPDVSRDAAALLSDMAELDAWPDGEHIKNLPDRVDAQSQAFDYMDECVRGRGDIFVDGKIDRAALEAWGESLKAEPDSRRENLPDRVSSDEDATGV